MAAHLCGSMITFMDSPLDATSLKPRPVSSRPNRWVIIFSIDILSVRRSSIASTASIGAFPYDGINLIV